MGNIEAQIQAAIVAWFDAVAVDAFIFHVANGGLRTKAEAGKLKWMGVKPGVADLVIVDMHGLVYFLEVKQPDGALSPAQKDFRDLCRRRRWPFEVAVSVTEAERHCLRWGIKLRGRVQA